MQNLDVISVNLWQILISLCNLILLFLILKKFLYQPVTRMMQKRQEELDERYAAADEAQRQAESNREAWEQKLQEVGETAQQMLKKAEEQADYRGNKIVSEAKEQADTIVRDARTQADLAYKKAQSDIKKEIVDVSAVLTEKIIGREIRPEDHREMIASVLSEIGDDNERD